MKSSSPANTPRDVVCNTSASASGRAAGGAAPVSPPRKQNACVATARGVAFLILGGVGDRADVREVRAGGGAQDAAHGNGSVEEGGARGVERTGFRGAVRADDLEDHRDAETRVRRGEHNLLERASDDVLSLLVRRGCEGAGRGGG